MTPRAGGGECRGDLVARAQRGPLSPAEQSALRAHLASCDSCRLIQQVASDYAGLTSVERGDDARLEQMSAVARLAARGGGRPTRRRRAYTPARAAAVAAGVILLAGTASAAVWLLPRLTWKAADKPVVAVAPLAEATSPARVRRPASSQSAALAPGAAPPVPAAPETVVRETAAVVPPPVVVAMAHPRPASRLARENPRASAPARAQGSATALLRDARAATTDGHGDEAVALYRRLQKDFPTSSEALVAAVPLGRLLLERVSPRAALAQFSRYLGAAPAGVLVPEALYGRAQSLARLGDHQEETLTWRRLVSDFPDSPYSALARRRLSELK